MNSNAGRTRHRITITRPTTTQDDFGGASVAYATVGTYWAEVSRSAGSRGLDYQQTTFKRPYMIILRGYIDVKEDDRLTFEGQTLVIQSIERDLARKRYTTIMATENYDG